MSEQLGTDIIEICKAIDRNITELNCPEQRGLLFQNLLSYLRDLVEHVAVLAQYGDPSREYFYDDIKPAIKYAGSKNGLRFLKSFHKQLQRSVSHYTRNEDVSERLMLKYLEQLFRIRELLRNQYSIPVLRCLEEISFGTDESQEQYYRDIACKVDMLCFANKGGRGNRRYYIQKAKPFFFSGNIYYELTITDADDNISKFDRVIAFSKFAITEGYAVTLSMKRTSISLEGEPMSILIIDGWSAAIRPCELKRIAFIFGKSINVRSNSSGYRYLMGFLTTTESRLLDLVSLEDGEYEALKQSAPAGKSSAELFDMLDACRQLLLNSRKGCNVVAYLIHNIRNRVIKQQLFDSPCSELSGLYLKIGCNPFDKMPYVTSLVNHNPRLYDLLDCIDPSGRDDEFLARTVKQNTESKSMMFTPIESLAEYGDLNVLMDRYKSKLYYKHANRQLIKEKGHLYIESYVEDAAFIIDRLKKLATHGVTGYANAVNYWLRQGATGIDCEEKRDALISMYQDSQVALLYGAAGTGKTRMIKHVADYHASRQILCLANTNPALDNLRRHVNHAHCVFSTIAQFIKGRTVGDTYDLVIIDECSTVSNQDMKRVLERARFSLLLLVGDVYQIEAIRFGNWFDIARSFLPTTAVFELTHPYRSSSTKLKCLWDSVRNMEDDILERLADGQFTSSFDETIFSKKRDDEIVLCLNYDGLYGINNINRFLQATNRNESVSWGIKDYKVGDPVLFTESTRFSPLLYNNMKGVIRAINKDEELSITFDIEIEKAIDQIDANRFDLEIVGVSSDGLSIVRFTVYGVSVSDEQDARGLPEDAIVPFQVAYAVSIHKAQGLEYDSVKIVISTEIEEQITHSIFYTAITRAKRDLTIYWSPQVEKRVLASLVRRDGYKDACLLRSICNL